MSHANPETDEGTRCLDEALEDTFPASDPPSMTSPMAATPSSDVIAEAPGPLRVYRVVEAAHASEPFAPIDRGGRWTPAGSACVYTSLSPACALLEYLAHMETGAPEQPLLLAVATAPAGTTLAECNEPSTWRQLPYRNEVQRVGEAFDGLVRVEGTDWVLAMRDGQAVGYVSETNTRFMGDAAALPPGTYTSPFPTRCT